MAALATAMLIGRAGQAAVKDRRPRLGQGALCVLGVRAVTAAVYQQNARRSSWGVVIQRLGRRPPDLSDTGSVAIGTGALEQAQNRVVGAVVGENRRAAARVGLVNHVREH